MDVVCVKWACLARQVYRSRPNGKLWNGESCLLHRHLWLDGGWIETAFKISFKSNSNLKSCTRTGNRSNATGGVDRHGEI